MKKLFIIFISLILFNILYRNRYVTNRGRYWHHTCHSNELKRWWETFHRMVKFDDSQCANFTFRMRKVLLSRVMFISSLNCLLTLTLMTYAPSCQCHLGLSRANFLDKHQICLRGTKTKKKNILVPAQIWCFQFL